MSATDVVAMGLFLGKGGGGGAQELIIAQCLVSQRCIFTIIAHAHHTITSHWLALTDQTLDLEDTELNAGSRHRYKLINAILALSLSPALSYYECHTPSSLSPSLSLSLSLTCRFFQSSVRPLNESWMGKWKPHVGT